MKRNSLKINNNSRIKTRLIFILIFILLAATFFLNYRLIKSAQKEEVPMAFPTKEKEFMDYISDCPPEKRDSLSKQLLNEVSFAENSTAPESKSNLGKLHYYLGFNNLLMGNHDLAEEAFNKSISILDDTSEDYYVLAAHNDLMNLKLHKGDTVAGIKHGIEIYSELKKSVIHGMSETGQESLNVNVLAGLLTTSSNFNLKNTSDKFYEELSEIVKRKPDLDFNISVYARYQYHLNNKNYPEAVKLANKYLEYFDDDSEVSRNGAHFYLLEAHIFNKDFDKVPELLKIVESAYKELDSPILYAHLYRVKGLYYYFTENFEEAINWSKKALALFEEIEDYENCLAITNMLIELADKNNLSKEDYLKIQREYTTKFNYVDKVEALNDAFIQVAYKKIGEENILLKNEAEFVESLNNASNNMNLLYIFIIILLAIITKTLDKEIMKRKLKESELNEIISTDYLTKAYSRKFILEELDKLRNDNADFALLIFDLDKFKKINDTLGHNYGDIVLTNVVKAVKKAIGNTGLIGRFGGEEFIVILDNSIPKEYIVEKIRNAISEIKWDVEDLNVTISGGMKSWDKEENITNLIAKVDQLLYEAKETGRNKIIIQ